VRVNRSNPAVVVRKAQTPSVLLLDAPLTSWGINVEWAKYISGAIESEMRYFTDDNDQFSKFLELLWNGLLGMKMPVGAISPYAGTSIPTKWLECNGQAVSRTTYAALFAVCGATYGNGNGTTTFNLPHLNGRTAIGKGTSDLGDSYAIGSKTGSPRHKLSVNEMPAHSHSATVYNAVGTSAAFARGSTASAGGTAGVSSAGSDGSHQNMQPSLALTYMIYADV